MRRARETVNIPVTASNIPQLDEQSIAAHTVTQDQGTQILVASRENLSWGFSTRSDTNQVVRPQKIEC